MVLYSQFSIVFCSIARQRGSQEVREAFSKGHRQSRWCGDDRGVRNGGICPENTEVESPLFTS
jgi:hypothetical protein